MHIWQVQEAKAKLTQFINEAKHEPQIISRRGEPEIVAISIERYNQLISSKKTLLTLMKSSPLYQSELDIVRDKSDMRDVDL